MNCDHREQTELLRVAGLMGSEVGKDQAFSADIRQVGGKLAGFIRVELSLRAVPRDGIQDPVDQQMRPAEIIFVIIAVLEVEAVTRAWSDVKVL